MNIRDLSAAFALLACASTACDETTASGDTPVPTVTPPASLPEALPVAGALTVVGVELGTLRADVDVASFLIAKEPAATALYSECVESNGCAPLSNEGCAATAAMFGVTASPELSEILVCATPQEAEDLCSWLGGRLPRAQEWLLAARGAAVQRFPWKERPTCAASRFAFGHALGSTDCEESTTGMRNILRTPGELLAQDPKAVFPACRGEACAVGGLAAHAIDVVEPASATKLAVAPTFRCVWEVSK